jgi:hypothetical protein
MITPAGEIGRPGDNLYRPTRVEAWARRLLIELDEQQLLVLTNPALLTETPDHLSIGFDQLTLEWADYGSTRLRATTWTEGALDLIAQGR